MTSVSIAELKTLTDFAAHEERVSQAIRTACASPEALLRFFSRYTSWNGYFGSGVATLAGKIGRSRRLFRDSSEPIDALADRSVLVASYIFDAARDEFDDRSTAYRDTHRDLAQAMLSGLIHYVRGIAPQLAESPAVLNERMADPDWLRTLDGRVAQGYASFSQDMHDTIFAGIGYHLGSELLADREFSIIDAALRRDAPALVTFLEQHRERIGEQDHSAYVWITIHSGGGGAVEEDHFRLALEGVNFAFGCVPAAARDEARRHLHYGFQNFARDHREFFTCVNHS